jgi:hypothetical protein
MRRAASSARYTIVSERAIRAEASELGAIRLLDSAVEEKAGAGESHRDQSALFGGDRSVSWSRRGGAGIRDVSFQIDRDHLLWVMLEPTVRSRFRVRSSALCGPTFETKRELDG